MRQLWQLLDYVAVDYAGAVDNGVVVKPSEFAEMREFSTTAKKRLQDLPAAAWQGCSAGASRRARDRSGQQELAGGGGETCPCTG